MSEYLDSIFDKDKISKSKKQDKKSRSYGIPQQDESETVFLHNRITKITAIKSHNK